MNVINKTHSKDHNFVLMNDFGLKKEYLCTSCKSKAVMTIQPRQPICYDKQTSVRIGDCHKDVFL